MPDLHALQDAFACLDPADMKGALPASRLGQREIEVMDVTIIQSKLCSNDEERRLRAAIEWAVDHGRGRHWVDRPSYEQGLAAWEMWSQAMHKAAIGSMEPNTSAEKYFSSMACAARLNAARFLREHGGNDGNLMKASEEYDKITAILKKLVDAYSGDHTVTNDERKGFAQDILAAGACDRRAIEHLEVWLAR